MPGGNADPAHVERSPDKSEVPSAAQRASGNTMDRFLLATWVLSYALLLRIFRFLRYLESHAPG